jgi:hypothetical protein
MNNTGHIAVRAANVNLITKQAAENICLNFDAEDFQQRMAERLEGFFLDPERIDT